MNRHGQIGKVITSLPVMILIISIIAIFIFLSAVARVLKGGSSFEAIEIDLPFVASERNLLIQMVSVEDVEGFRKTSFIELVAKYLNEKNPFDKKDINALAELLSSLMKDDECIIFETTFIGKSRGSSGFLQKKIKGENKVYVYNSIVNRPSDEFRKYEALGLDVFYFERGSLPKISDSRVKVISYYGRCL